MISNSAIDKFQIILKYKFKDKNKLINSLIHPSYYKDKKNKYPNNFERFEFLGDRVLGLTIASLIFNKFINFNEGDLTRKFSYLVRQDFLYKIALEINLGEYIKYKIQKNNSKLNKSVLADSMESIIGAIFLDGGYISSSKFIKRLWTPYLDLIESNAIDPKTKLQEISQKKLKTLPEYKLIKKGGPSHSPSFIVSLKALNLKPVKGNGKSIREAEKNAAIKILNIINEK